jgi:hypothetical protein
MNLPEQLLAENLDEIIRRSTRRLEQEMAHVGLLREGGEQHIAAKYHLAVGMAALGRLKVYRAKFGQKPVLQERRKRK